jgi:hypothetical protein
MAIGNCGRNGTVNCGQNGIVNCGQKDTVLWSKRHPGLFSISRSLSLSLCLCFLWRGISAASRIKKNRPREPSRVKHLGCLDAAYL